jgi:tRNA-specific 2-thiouridylase
MSGGVDSSVAASLLLEEGYAVEGVSLLLWEEQGPLEKNCSNHTGAAEVAESLGIRHSTLDMRSEFRGSVVESFARHYANGLTPNPCVACNRSFKLGALLQWAKRRGIDYVATGHYARIGREPASGRLHLERGLDRQKDQSYFLFDLSQEQLNSTLFPLGRWRKTQVREKARERGLPAAERPESQDICFTDHRDLVASLSRQGRLSPGLIVDRSGKILGRHPGLHHFTIGQRKGLGLSSPAPLYVVDIDRRDNRVIVGHKDEVGSRGLIARGVSWQIMPESEKLEAEVQVRYRSVPLLSAIHALGHGRHEVRFADSTAVVAPGQAVVFYRGDRVLGGGWIESAIR